MGGNLSERTPVTDQPRDGSVYRVLLNGRHVASKGTKQEAEEAIAGWLEEFDGEFTVKVTRPKKVK